MLKGDEHNTMEPDFVPVLWGFIQGDYRRFSAPYHLERQIEGSAACDWLPTERPQPELGRVKNHPGRS